MKVMVKETSLSTNQVLEEAVMYFNGLFGLQIQEHIPNCCIEFSNEIGYVTVQIILKETGKEVVLTTREWDYQVLEFLNGLHS